jgi:hypothetical protein
MKIQNAVKAGASFPFTSILMTNPTNNNTFVAIAYSNALDYQFSPPYPTGNSFTISNIASVVEKSSLTETLPIVGALYYNVCGLSNPYCVPLTNSLS